MTRYKSLSLDLLFLLAGIALALALMPLISAGIAELRDMHDANNPPTRFKVVEHQHVPPDTLRMRFEVSRLEDCDLMRLAGFSRAAENVPLEPAVVLRREDGSHVIPFPVGSTYLSPWWVMQPVYGPRIRIYGYYDCAGRLVRSKLIDEVLLP